jgi:hypothetical protein
MTSMEDGWVEWRKPSSGPVQKGGSELLVKREGKASVLRQAALCLVCS